MVFLGKGTVFIWRNGRIFIYKTIEERDGRFIEKNMFFFYTSKHVNISIGEISSVCTGELYDILGQGAVFSLGKI